MQTPAMFKYGFYFQIQCFYQNIPPESTSKSVQYTQPHRFYTEFELSAQDQAEDPPDAL